MAALDIASHIGHAVRRHRQVLRLTQEELAGRADLDRTYIGQIEQGRRNPTMISLQRVAHALGLELDVLVATARDIAAENADAVSIR
ncbi:helix-turn-helix transcriptional regulator [Novosphingobium piscinae]|uniref:Helix-turn-helix transcriptional regulator n=1 Tax=Novosphingobium piscinae TaxID=1507448 RepID=A0A7X1FWE0_9SPHN|nr:helix-turn-helix transcriptional regulator [Novosphingobium piscinae]